MAQNCDPCVCPERWYRDSQSWRKAVITLLCDIAGADQPPIHIGAVDVMNIAAGDNNIGNVDIASLPAGNLGQQLMAASLSIVPASDITDPTYIGDIKFGESLPSGTNIIGAVKKDVINYAAIQKVYSAATPTDGIIWSPAAGKKWAVTDLVVSTSAASVITFEDDTSGGDVVVLKLDLAANGGLVVNLQTPLMSSEDDADLVVTASAGTVYVTAIGYEFD